MSIGVHSCIVLDPDGCLRDVGVDQRFEFCESRGDCLDLWRRLHEHARLDHLFVVDLEVRIRTLVVLRRRRPVPQPTAHAPCLLLNLWRCSGVSKWRVHLHHLGLKPLYFTPRRL